MISEDSMDGLITSKTSKKKYVYIAVALACLIVGLTAFVFVRENNRKPSTAATLNGGTFANDTHVQFTLHVDDVTKASLFDCQSHESRQELSIPYGWKKTTAGGVDSYELEMDRFPVETHVTSKYALLNTKVWFSHDNDKKRWVVYFAVEYANTATGASPSGHGWEILGRGDDLNVDDWKSSGGVVRKAFQIELHPPSPGTNSTSGTTEQP